MTERVTLNPLRLTSFASSPEGRAFGKGVKFILYRSAGEGDTFRLRQSLALRERWQRRKAMTERVISTYDHLLLT